MTLKPATRGILFGLAAAVSFGLSAPLAKVLLSDVEPQLLAGLLYLGAFGALVAVGRLRRTSGEARLRRTDAPRLAVVVVVGGVVAPVLLLLGLERVSGVSGSLLLNVEGPLTILVGVALFREHLSRHAALGAGVIFAGAILLTIEGGGNADWLGLVLVAGACAAWAIDNNVTQSLTERDPRTIVTIKTGCAGAINLAIAVAIGQSLPTLAVIGAALALGGISYGLSVYWDALALRHLGAAREAAIFAVAPFVGALVAPLVLPEAFGVQELAAGLLMGCGVALLLTEHHVHAHRHQPIAHDHLHEHDEHHAHVHGQPVAPGTRHSHTHRHDEQVHSHDHVSDLHHRHGHERPR